MGGKEINDKKIYILDFFQISTNLFFFIFKRNQGLCNR